MGNYAIVRNGAIAFRTSFLAWFGYGKDGKPLAKGTTKMPVIKFLNLGAVQLAVTTRLSTWTANLKAAVYKSVGLGPDGKKLGNRFQANPQGSGARSVPNGMAQGFGKGFFRTVSSRVGSFLSPLLRISAAIAAWSVGASGTALAGTLKTLGGSLKNGVMKIPGVGFAARLIGRILWPVTLLFSLFEGFKAGKAESEKESSNWYTILGEGVGGVLGYLLGGLVDLVKNAAIWLITKGFGLTTDDEGVIQGDGLGVKVLNIIKEFSFMDLIRKIVAAPFHMVSNIAGFITGMFTDADFRSGVWTWITDMPGRIVNWFKGMIPEKVRKFFGIELTGGLDPVAPLEKYTMPASVPNAYRESMRSGSSLAAAQWRAMKPYEQAADVREYKQGFQKMMDDRNLEAYNLRVQRQLDIANGAIDPQTLRPFGHVANTNNNIQVINYESGKYGNLLTNAFSEQM